MGLNNEDISTFLYRKRWLAFILTIMFLVFGAYLGGLVSSPVTNISFWWLPSGVALASLLLFGYGMTPAILIGAVGYDIYIFSQLFNNLPFQNVILVSTIMGLGTTLQAVVGAKLVRHYSPVYFFHGVKDIFYFLLYGGILTCTIAATIGVTAMYLGHFLEYENITKIWLNFWLGDTVGVFIVTPLLVIWASKKQCIVTHVSKWEKILGTLIFLVISFLLFGLDYPLAILYLPIIIWASMRFYVRGASLSTFIVCSASIIGAFLGYGAVAKSTISDPLIIVNLYSLFVAGIALFLATALQERETACLLLKRLNQNLEQILGIKTLELDEIQQKLGLKEKLASLGSVIGNISLKVKAPLTYVHGLTNLSKDFIDMLENAFEQKKHLFDPETQITMTHAIEGLKASLLKLGENEKQANKIVDVMIQHTMAESNSRLEYRLLNINSLLDRCLDQISAEIKDRYDDLQVVFEKSYDENAVLIDVIPEDLAHAFHLLLDNSVYALAQKLRVLRDEFAPIIRIQTEDDGDYINIYIKHNGIHTDMGDLLMHKELESGLTGLSIAHDIIVNEHQGRISVNDREIEALEIMIHLPKTRQLARSA